MKSKPIGIIDVERLYWMQLEAEKQARIDARKSVNKYRYLFKKIGKALRPKT